MHEAGLCVSLIALAERSAQDAGAQRIVSVGVAIGELSGVVPKAIELAFPICATGTRAEGAALRIERIAGRDFLLRDLEVE